MTDLRQVPTAQSGRVHPPNRPSTQQLTDLPLGHAHALEHRLKQIAAEILKTPSRKRNRGKSSEILETPSLKRNRGKSFHRPGHQTKNTLCREHRVQP